MNDESEFVLSRDEILESPDIVLGLSPETTEALVAGEPAALQVLHDGEWLRVMVYRDEEE